MSDAAILGRDRRLRWARPGSGHDRSVRLARIALPAAVGVLAAVLAMSPLAKRAEVSFVLDKDKVAVAQERMRATRAEYRGLDDKNQPFRLTAGSAVQATSRDPVVQLGDLVAELTMQRGPARIVAPDARYDMDAETLRVDGPLTFTGSDGYRLATADIAADLNRQTLSSETAVSGTMPLGRFTADRMQADLRAETVVLDGRVRLHIAQSPARKR